MSFANVGVKTRLFVAFGFLTLAVLAVGGSGLRSLGLVNANVDGILDDRLMPVVWINAINASDDQDLIALDEALLNGDAQAGQSLRQRYQQTTAATEDLWKKYAGTEMAEGEDELAGKFWMTRPDYIALRNRTLDALVGNQLEQARTLRKTELAQAYNAMLKPLEALLDLQNKVAESDRIDSRKQFSDARWVSVAAMIAGICMALFFGVTLSRSIMRSLDQALRISERIAGGELGNQYVIEGKDEFARLLSALRDMDGKLSGVVAEVHAGAGSVGTAARELATGNDDLSQRTQEQASALEETASSMEQMTATVKQNSDSARQANQLALSARQHAEQGGQVVSRAVGAMVEINEASNQIADIIGVIDEIAFQTNLLALNAAVEAARAGEQGRGFAVVASEVRNLAQRSAVAAKEIKDLISNSVAKVEAGSALVNESGKTLQEIMNSIRKVADIVAEISAASEEQAAGIEQVNTAVTQMDAVTQQNAALVEQASAASKSMEERAASLVQQVSFFKVAGARQQTSAEAPNAAAQMHEPTRKTGLTLIRKSTSASKPVASVQRVANAGQDAWVEF